ncbi:acid protease [Laetiporus sulphureus 93-53]|uniref:Acid protease n=1 Tax=Laetiporus sulphureus 93-53 TaxID=1314785 RepID=A0A165B7T1_9APHY|nr:acid protease [Laetiporus sulphureus 93-53]KZT00441.1 acid protease [Laetiporus sulphureus 93-53]
MQVIDSADTTLDAMERAPVNAKNRPPTEVKFIVVLRGGGEATTIPATNLAYMQCTASIGVGNPATYYDLVVDTASSNTIRKTYIRTSMSIPTGQEVNVMYPSGFFSEYEYVDQVTIASGLVIKNQSISDTLEYADFEGVDGIIGVGPMDLTLDTLYPGVNAEIWTVMNNAYEQGLILEQLLGVSFAPADSYSDTNGALTFGGIDSSLYTGEITYTPVTTTHLIYIADNFHSTHQNTIPGTYYDNTGLIIIPESSVTSMQNFDFEIVGTTFTLDAEAQRLPRDQNLARGVEPGLHYGYISPIGSPSGEGLDFIIGQKFMGRYYASFDMDNQLVGFPYT